MRITVSVLHPGIGKQQAVAISLLVRDLLVQKLVALICRTSLNHPITSKDTVDDVDVLC